MLRGNAPNESLRGAKGRGNRNQSEKPENMGIGDNQPSTDLPPDNKRIVKDAVLNVPYMGGGRDSKLIPETKYQNKKGIGDEVAERGSAPLCGQGHHAPGRNKKLIPESNYNKHSL